MHDPPSIVGHLPSPQIFTLYKLPMVDKLRCLWSASRLIKLLKTWIWCSSLICLINCVLIRWWDTPAMFLWRILRTTVVNRKQGNPPHLQTTPQQEHVDIAMKLAWTKLLWQAPQAMYCLSLPDESHADVQVVLSFRERLVTTFRMQHHFRSTGAAFRLEMYGMYVLWYVS